MITTVNLPLPVANGPGAAVDTSAMGRVKTIFGVGTFPGATLAVEVSVDGGVSFAPVMIFQNGAREELVEVAAQYMRVNVSGRKNSLPFSATIDVGSDDIGGMFTTIALPAGNGTGPVVNVTAFGTLTTFVAGGTFAGATITVEASGDGSAFAP